MDGFICGFVLSGLGVKIKFKEFLISLTVIFICCTTASLRGKYLAYTQIDRYINIFGGCVLLYLAVVSLWSENQIKTSKSIAHISLSVAADASVACLYLAMYGYSILTIAILSAFLHCVLMYMANVLAYTIVKPFHLKYTRYLSCGIFAFMAVAKFIGI